MDWNDWHQEYDDPDSSLSRRRRLVQAQINTWLDSRTDESLRIVSVCAGDGRDVLDVLAARADSDRVSVVLIESDPTLARAAAELAKGNGLERIDVRVRDAGVTDAYVGAVPADLVMMCGVFGNIRDRDVSATINMLDQLCAAGATVLWTRGKSSTNDPMPRIRRWFVERGLEEIAFDAPSDASYRFGVNRFAAAPRTLEPGRAIFSFTR